MSKSGIAGMRKRQTNWRALGDVAKRTAGAFVLAALVMGAVHYLNRTRDRPQFVDLLSPPVGAATVRPAPDGISPAALATPKPAAAAEEEAINHSEYYCTPHPC